MQRELRPIVSKLKEIQQKMAGFGGRSPELAMAAMMLETLVESLRTGRDPSGQPTDLEEVVAALTFPAKAAESLGLSDTVAQIVFVQRQLLDLVEAERRPAPVVKKAPPAPVATGPGRAELAGRMRAIRDSLAERASVSSDVASVMTILERLADALETGRAPNGSAIQAADIPAGLKVPIVVLENQQMASQVGALQALQREIAALAERLRAAPAATPDKPFRPKQPKAAAEETSSAEVAVGCSASVVFATLGVLFLQVLGDQVIGFPPGVSWFGAAVLGILLGLLVAVVLVESVKAMTREGKVGAGVAGLGLLVIPWLGAGGWGAYRFVNPPAPAEAASQLLPPTPAAGEPAPQTLAEDRPGPSPETVEPTAVSPLARSTAPPLATPTPPPPTERLADEVARLLAYGDHQRAVDRLLALRSTERQTEEARQAAVTVTAALRAHGRQLMAQDGDSVAAEAAFSDADRLQQSFGLEPPGVTEVGGQREFPASRPEGWKALEGELVEVVPSLGSPYEARLVKVGTDELELRVVSAVGGGEVTIARSVPVAKVRSIRHPVLRVIEPTRTPTPRWGRG